MYGRSAAIIGAVLILFDPSLLMHARLDWGPTALMFFFKGVLALSLANWVLSGHPKWAWLSLFAILLGVFDKLNFLWLAGASVCALAVSYPKQLRGFAVNHPRHACLLFLMGGLVFSAAFWYATNLSSTLGDTYQWNQRVHQVLRLMKLVLVGGGPLDFVAGDGMRLRLSSMLDGSNSECWDSDTASATTFFDVYFLVVCWSISSLCRDTSSNRVSPCRRAGKFSTGPVGHSAGAWP
jgi:hypothetical protein